MQESTIERRLVREVEKRCGAALKFVSPGNRGVPDRLILLPGGKVCFAEIKAPGKKMTAIQEYQAERLRKLGHTVYRVDNVDKFLAEVFGDDIYTTQVSVICDKTNT